MTDCETATIDIDPFESVTECFCCAQKFVDRLVELQDEWQDRGWIFRGQNDATWDLQPKLFRSWKPEYGSTYEFRLVDNFIRNANLVQLEIPSNTMNYSTYYRRGVPAPSLGLMDENTGSGLVYDYTHSVFAIAQHAGIPTRLLDFTYDALVAAFFAWDTNSLVDAVGLSNEKLARCFVEIAKRYEGSPDEASNTLRHLTEQYQSARKSMPETMAVWALQENKLEFKTALRVLSHPHTEIVNLRAQQGLFVYHRDIIDLHDEYAKCVSSFSEEVLKLTPKQEVLRLTLPHSEASDLWDILKEKRMGYMYIYPNYENVAKAVLEGQDKFIAPTVDGLENVNTKPLPRNRRPHQVRSARLRHETQRLGTNLANLHTCLLGIL